MGVNFSGLKVLFSGPLTRGGTCEMRRHTLEKGGARAWPLSYLPFFRNRIRIIRRAERWFRLGPSVAGYNRELRTSIRDNKPNLLWVEKGLFVHPESVLYAKSLGAVAIHYSPDNYFIRQNTSRFLKRSLKEYDLVVTTKPGAEEMLKRAGARRTFLSGNAYDERMHRPVILTPEEMEVYGCDLTFIGRWEQNREELMDAIIQTGISVRIWGPHWKRTRIDSVRKVIGGPAEAGAYAKAINGAAITLCLLSRLAKDTITQRSVEIPACGGFMLAERTADHLAHFEEGKEAEYFGSTSELMEKIRYYLAHPEERRAIAAAGRERCVRSGYSYTARLHEIIQQVPELAQHSSGDLT